MAQLKLSESLGNEMGDAVSNHLLEASDIGNEVGAEVVTVDVGPEAGVLGTLKLAVQGAKLGEGFVELTGLGGGGVDEV